jgi:general secretion pathway protein A
MSPLDDARGSPDHKVHFMQRQQSAPLTHWGLQRWPFRGSPAAAQFYPTPGHNEALARIDHLVEARLRVGVLVGEAGVGKTVVFTEAAKQLRRQGRAVAVVDALGTATQEFLWQIAGGLKSPLREDADVPWLWRRIADRIAENRVQQISTVILVDDAGSAGPDLLTQFARLARLDNAPRARLTIVLASQPGPASRWNDSLRNLIDLRIELSAWSSEDTIGYVQMALVEAGRFEPLFEDQALAALHELTRGIPKQVAQLADFSLMAGAAAELEMIDAATVEAAYDELAWPAPAEAY